MTKLIMIDQKMRHRKVNINPDFLAYGMLSVLLIILAFITALAICDKIKNNYGSNNINYDDFTISDDMRDYMMNEGHGKIFTEQDIE